MGASAQHVWTDANQLVYLVTSFISGEFTIGGTVTISADGSASPDLVTDAADASYGRAASVALTRVCRAGLDGLGNIAAGAWTQAQARALLMLDGSAAIGGVLTPRTRLRLSATFDAGGEVAACADVDVDGSGNPEINVTVANNVGSVYLYVELNHSLAA